MTCTVGPLKAGNEDYCVRAVAQGREDYYTGHGEQVGRWIGAGAEELGLVGKVDADIFRAVLAGKSPDGEQLVKRKKAGFDVTFSPPKSISVLWGLGDDDVARIVQASHREAMAAAVGYLESQAAVVGVRAHGRAGGIEIKRAEGFVAAAFDHRTSRAGDPQLHSHVVVSNMARAPNDQWRALGRHPDLYHHAKAAGALYECELRKLLTERLGVDWTWDDDHPEVVGVPGEIAEHFAKRHAEAVAAVEARGLAPTPKAMQSAVLLTRRPKTGHIEQDWSHKARDYGVEPSGVEGLRARWEREACEAGFPALDMDSILGQHVEHEVDIASVNKELAGPHGLTETRATFARRDVVQAFAALPGGSALDALRLADSWLASGEAVCLGSRQPGSEDRWTTWDLLGQEQSLLRAARERAGAGVAVVDSDVVEGVVGGRGLSDEQADMVRQLTTSGRGVEVVVGRAGVGKTFSLDAAREAWEVEGVPVLGTALSAAAAGELRRGAKVDARTVARQIIETYRDGLPAGCVLVVDEASMVDTRSLAALSRAVEKAGGKLVLVGDDKQLPSIQSGGTFARLVERAGEAVVELTEVRRQTSEADRAALADIRHGDVAAGIRGLVSRDGRTVTAADASSKHLAMVSDWVEARAAGQEVLMLARSRRRVEEMAGAARDARRAAGELGDELEVKLTPEPAKRRSEHVWVPDARSFSVGDEVLFGRNTTGKWRHLRESMPGVFNGAGGVVDSIDAEAGTLTVRLAGDDKADSKWQEARARQETEITELTARLESATDPRDIKVLRDRLRKRLDDRRAGIVLVDGRRTARPATEVTVDHEYLAAGHVSLAYARTVHKSQGATADVVLIDADDLHGREAVYVAMSRHRADVRVFVSRTLPPVDRERHQSPPRRWEGVEGLVERAARSEAQRAAAASMSRAGVEHQERVRELASRTADELAAEGAAVEAGLGDVLGARDTRKTTDVERAEAEVAEAEARAAATGSVGDRHAAWLASARLAAEQERAARAAVHGRDRAVEARRDELARLAELRTAEARARRRE